jgi:hypothetical protein
LRHSRLDSSPGNAWTDLLKHAPDMISSSARCSSTSRSSMTRFVCLRSRRRLASFFAGRWIVDRRVCLEGRYLPIGVSSYSVTPVVPTGCMVNCPASWFRASCAPANTRMRRKSPATGSSSSLKPSPHRLPQVVCSRAGRCRGATGNDHSLGAISQFSVERLSFRSHRVFASELARTHSSELKNRAARTDGGGPSLSGCNRSSALIGMKDAVALAALGPDQ